MKVNYQPLKEIVIHHLSEKSYDDFVSIHAIEGEHRPIWCGGYLFQPYTFPDNDQIIKERLEGTLHYFELSYCECPVFPVKIKRKDQSFELPVHNLNRDEMFKEIVKYIKILK